MDSDEAIYVANQIVRIVNGELDDAERALRSGNSDKARRELEDAVDKLKKVAARLKASV